MNKLIALLLFFPSLVFAQAQVFPTHLTLTEEAPSTYLNLKNTTGQTQKYKIDLMQFQMGKDGSMKRAPEANNPLVEIIKFSPKTVELAPNDKQIVRVMATAFDNLTDGEYYVHIHFTPIGEKEDDSPHAKKKSSSFSLQARIAVAVPIIVRKGTGTFDGKLEKFQAQIDKEKNVAVQLSLLNTTKYFLYGDLELIGVTDKGEVSLDRIVGLSSYLPERMFNRVFTHKEIAEKTSGEELKKIKVQYAANNESAAPFTLNSEADITAKAAKSGPAKKSKKKKS
jgi:hypothetical protein